MTSVLVLGAGVDGLAAAAALADGGRDVVVLEERSAPGGLFAPREFAPGYVAPGVLHDTAGVRRELVEALRLDDHGLAFRPAPTAVATREASGAWRCTDRLAGRDARELAEWHAFARRIRPLVDRALAAPAPALAPQGWRARADLLRHLVRLRRLGGDTMLELLRVLPMSAADLLAERFSDPTLRAALLDPTTIATFTGPRGAGTAAPLLLRACGEDREIEGGGPALVAALENACSARGVRLRCSVSVRRVLVEGGCTRGVELEGGEYLEARIVVSTLAPQRTLLELCAPGVLPAGLHEELRGWRTRGTAAKVHLALDGPFELQDLGALSGTLRLPGDLDGAERAFDPVKYGRLPARPHLDVRWFAAPRAGPQACGLSAMIHHVPYAAGRDAVLAAVLDTLEDAAPGIRDRIVAHEVLTPADLEAEYRAPRGHLQHGEHALDQLWWMRPAARCAGYATGIEGLWVAGPGTHPGAFAPGMSGLLAGRAARGAAGPRRLRHP